MSSHDRRRQSIMIEDGRALCFAEWGDPEGFPVFSLHGTPGGRRDRVVRARCAVGVVPLGPPEIDFFEGMEPQNATEFGWAVEGRMGDPDKVVERMRWLVSGE